MASKHILVIGATGQSGIDFCTLALEAKHQLTLYVRNASKVPTAVSSHPSVSIIVGTLESASSLERAASCGATVFVSFAGPTSSSVGTPITDSMRVLFPLLIAHHFSRALVLGTPSFVAPLDRGSWKWSASVALIKVIGGDAYREFSGLGALVTAQDVQSIRWTLFRVPFLGNGEAKLVTPAFTGSGKDGMFLNRKSAAAWVLAEMKEESEWVGKAPLLSN